MGNFHIYNDHERTILQPLGGTKFVERTVKAIRAAEESAFEECRDALSNPKQCDIMGEWLRAKIIDAMRGVAIATGLPYEFEKPPGQRYHNLIIQAKDTILTVSRAYGRNRVSRSSGFRRDLAQGQMSLFGETSFAYTVPDNDARTLILAYEVEVLGSHPIVTAIELQEIGTSPEDVTYRINFESRIDIQSDTTIEAIYDELDVRPKERAKRKHA